MLMVILDIFYSLPFWFIVVNDTSSKHWFVRENFRQTTEKALEVRFGGNSLAWTKLTVRHWKLSMNGR